MKIKNQISAIANLKTLFAAVALSSGLLFSSLGANLFAAAAFDSLTTLAPLDTVAIPAVPALSPLKPAKALNAYFISVGQGDAEYIELPNGQNVLIDGGPNPSTPLSQFLTQHNVTKIDYVVLTHPHLDHYSGLDYVFSHTKVSNFYDTREDNTGTAGAKTLRDKISGMGVKVSYPAPGDNLNWDPGEVKVKVLNSCPTPGASNSGPVLNNCSIVLKVTYHNKSILYTGDMQSDVEATLVSTYGSQLQSDVLKVGHHGSNTATSSAFLNMVKPKYAYIEVGAGNTFGFPAPVTLSNLQAVGATVYRTDLSGTQEYVIR
ncbi:MAG: MBL fold metallo-hydrolase [Elusimicrobia bacterium]|nr:MBL fold metallo-hydrolase [Elusimicrobiota bacterium]